MANKINTKEDSNFEEVALSPPDNQNIIRFVPEEDNVNIRLETANEANFLSKYKKKLGLIAILAIILFISIIGTIFALKHTSVVTASLSVTPASSRGINDIIKTNKNNETNKDLIENSEVTLFNRPTKHLKETPLVDELKNICKLTQVTLILQKSLMKNIQDLDLDNTDIYSLLILANDSLASSSKDTTVKIWNTTDFNLIRILKHPSPVRSMTLLSNDNLVCGSIGNIFVWNSISWELIRKIQVNLGDESIYSMTRMSNDLVIAGVESKIQIWNVSNSTLLTVFKDHEDKINSLVIVNDENLASASDDRTIKIWNLKNFTFIKTLFTGTAEVNSLLVTPNGRLVSGSSDNYLRVWNVSNYTLCSSIKTESILTLSSIDDNYVVSASLASNINIWDLNANTIVKSFKARSYFIWSLLVLPNNLLACGADLVYILNLIDGSFVTNLTTNNKNLI